jgi:hypothetical protein
LNRYSGRKERAASVCLDSGAEKDVIRTMAYSYLDFLIVQYYSASTNLFMFFKQLKAFNFGDILEAYTDQL